MTTQRVPDSPRGALGPAQLARRAVAEVGNLTLFFIGSDAAMKSFVERSTGRPVTKTVAAPKTPRPYRQSRVATLLRHLDERTLR